MSNLSKAERLYIRDQVIHLYQTGITIVEISKKHPEIHKHTIRRWIRDTGHTKRLSPSRSEEIVPDIHAPPPIRPKLSEEVPKKFVQGNELLKSHTLALAERKYRAGLDYQLSSAVWLSNCRYKLAIESTSLTGAHKVTMVPILPENIDWDNGVVKFSGQEFNVDCLVPDSAAAKIGLEMLMKLTGTDTTSTEDIKVQARQATASAERDAENQNTSGTNIILNRPKRKTLEEALEVQNGEQVQPGVDGNRSESGDSVTG